MKLFLIIITVLITLSAIWCISFLLDINLVSENWMRYCVVVLLSLIVLFIGFIVIKQLVLDWKNEN